MKSCPRHPHHDPHCPDCELKRDRQVTALLIILITAVAWTAFAMSDHAPRDGIAVEASR